MTTTEMVASICIIIVFVLIAALYVLDQISYRRWFTKQVERHVRWHLLNRKRITKGKGPLFPLPGLMEGDLDLAVHCRLIELGEPGIKRVQLRLNREKKAGVY